jgi:hypothetical protein
MVGTFANLVKRYDMKEVLVKHSELLAAASSEPATLQHVQQQPSEPGQAGAAQNWEQQQQQGNADLDAEINNAQEEVWLDEAVIALLPVMCATALQLAYVSLTCVRLTRTKVLEGV